MSEKPNHTLSTTTRVKTATKNSIRNLSKILEFRYLNEQDVMINILMQKVSKESCMDVGALTAGSWSTGEAKWFTELDNTVHTIVTD